MLECQLGGKHQGTGTNTSWYPAGHGQESAEPAQAFGNIALDHPR
jgi:hypothetical protein